MTTSVFLASERSTLGERVASRTRGPCAVIPWAEAHVSVVGRDVRWGGTLVSSAEAVVFESAPIAWAQPLAAPRHGERFEELQRRGLAGRERRALQAAAARVLAIRVRTANPPERAATFASTPALALRGVQLARVPVVTWRVASSDSASSASIALEPSAEFGPAPARGASAVLLDVGEHDVQAHLMCGGRYLASARPGRLGESQRGQVQCCAPLAPAQVEIARAAVEALGLVFAAVHCRGERVAWIDPQPDLDAWDRASDSRVAQALADWLDRGPAAGSTAR